MNTGLGTDQSVSTIDQSIADMREEYKSSTLQEADVERNPMKQFESWFEQARAAKLLEANSMVLSTVSDSGQPNSRVVLLKGLANGGFTFYTNYDSAKGQQIAANPVASLVFLWQPLERQVRVEGRIVKVSEADSDAYFNSRPIGSQLGAMASPQSKVITRSELEARLEEVTRSHGDNPSRPAHWGGYRVIPAMVEFWQGRRSRLHDRIRYQRASDDSAWVIDRLGP